MSAYLTANELADMIGRRTSPDGLPFRLYHRAGKFKVSYGYKLLDGKWAFRLSAPSADKEAAARIRKQAIERAEVLNGTAPVSGGMEELIRKYFQWQLTLPEDSEDRKAEITLKENAHEAKRLIAVFVQTKPMHIKPVHIYKYLAPRSENGAPAKANKEIALLSSVLEYGRRLGELEVNPCRGIKYNKTRPRQKYVDAADLEYVLCFFNSGLLGKRQLIISSF